MIGNPQFASFNEWMNDPTNSKFASFKQWETEFEAVNAGTDIGLAPVPLPQVILDAIADPQVASVVVPHGLYTLETQLFIERSNLDLDFDGSTIHYTPANGAGLSQAITPQSTVAPIVDPLAPTRTASHLTGQVTAATTQLTMAEIVDVAPGEVVTIVAGTDKFDPVEPERYINATVLSVVGNLITFTAPLGTDITVYASFEAYQAVTAEAFWPKMGPWGEDRAGNYAKGLGLDHGLLRYVGGKVSDITIRNLNWLITIPADVDMPPGAGAIVATDVNNFSLINVNSHNVVGVMLHTWRCANVTVNSMRITGTGRQNVNQGFTFVGYAISTWGGSTFQYNDLNISGENIVVAAVEVSPGEIVYERLIYNVNFVDNWSSGFAAAVFNFVGRIWGGPPQIRNSTLTISGAHFRIEPTGATIIYNNPVFTTASFPQNMNFDYPTIEGTITVGGVAYGPMVTQVGHIISIPTGGTRTISLPVGFYKSVRARVLSGTMDQWKDGWGNTYLKDGNWQSAFEHVGQSSPLTNVPAGGTALTNYFANLSFGAYGPVVSAQVEFDVEYYPRAGGAGWIVT